ncbi:protealysin inhibitor emfourin [Curtobacterium sp. MCPF17_052]|uniref:protealysin inhibitor emfourin n=1 Tax=Curtobacterium sp. MCPF17_052 TaxID=2175655 RepID=UPI00346440F4
MQIVVRRSGGFAGMTRAWRLDTDDRPDADRWAELVGALPPRPGTGDGPGCGRRGPGRLRLDGHRRPDHGHHPGSSTGRAVGDARGAGAGPGRAGLTDAGRASRPCRPSCSSGDVDDRQATSMTVRRRVGRVIAT